MAKESAQHKGTHLSFTPAHDSASGDNHVDGQRWHDGQLDRDYGREHPETQHVPQSDGYGNCQADIPVRQPEQ